jgi:hypothetical protein
MVLMICSLAAAPPLTVSLLAAGGCLSGVMAGYVPLRFSFN